MPTRYQQSIELIEGSWAAKFPQTLFVADNQTYQTWFGSKFVSNF
jgi:hypothetical protein